jgi:hypothetical protein
MEAPTKKVRLNSTEHVKDDSSDLQTPFLSMTECEEILADNVSDLNSKKGSVNDDYFSKYPILPWIMTAIKVGDIICSNLLSQNFLSSPVYRQERPKSQRVTIDMIIESVWEQRFKDMSEQNSTETAATSEPSSPTMTREDVAKMVETVVANAIRLGCISQYLHEYYRLTDKAATFHRSKEAVSYSDSPSFACILHDDAM